VINTTKLNQIETETKEILLEAGKRVLKSQDNIKNIKYLDTRDIVTDIDVEIEIFLRRKLVDILPEAGFLVEEGQSLRKSIYNWTIDPLDQTKNYIAQLPLYYVQIALLENDIPILGHIYQPFSNQLFSASKVNKTTLNGKQVIIENKRKVKSAIIDIDLGGFDNKFYDLNCKIISELIKDFYRIRVTGGAYPIYLLTGAIDAYMVLNRTTGIYDQAPRFIIMREAGFKTEYLQLKDRQILISANSEIYSAIKNILLSVDAKHYLH
jgi:myo-inositol-1(or 4)-monophosphatase